jgi:hypothetical protein
MSLTWEKGDVLLLGVSHISCKGTTPHDNSCGASAGTLAHMSRMCANGHVLAAQDALHGVQGV